MSPISSLAVFCINTPLSPSAVIPEWAKAIISPALFAAKNPYPPTLSTRVVPTSLVFQVIKGFTEQHKQIKYKLAGLFYNKQSAYKSFMVLKPIFKITVLAKRG